MRGFIQRRVIGPAWYGLVALPLTLVGRHTSVRELRRRRLGIADAATTAGSVLASIAAFPLALLALYLVFAGELYPLRPDTISHVGSMFTASSGLANAWGGPTLAGAWTAHAAIAAGGQIVCLLLLAALGRIGVERRR